MDEMCLNIGEAAGYVYRLLENEESNMANLKSHLKENGYDQQMVFMAIGWLSREDKICMTKNGNSWSLKLK
ncbi:winged helix-turn-helix domain-containing protein [Methanolobus sediminis]|uniref:Winged helix-turn-helix domain-containing protein n=1 Tax=Methanolobus sediminis TaxID=3072978 RepID=A0AA51ULH5_9EURY|nr:winged helix-turn-helix domain-containing protein [Methanolobus sediminis]WMW25472.1 winged helix-turn-helix domain-containing protein [Methanolobus sediminis]